MSDPRINSVRHFFCGLAMGAADAVPGISGGTVALVLGIYRRLVDAISQVNIEAFQLLRKREWKALAERFDIWFLLALLGGIACGILTFVTILHDLIGEPDHPARTKPLVYATFFGAIAASGYLVTRMIHPKNLQHAIVCVVLAIVGGGFAYWLTSLPELTDYTTAPNPLVSFLLGAIAICAMILPGISGSYLLLILGAYHYFSGIPKALAKGQLVMEDLFAFVCFALGCVVGILSFSKFLKWLLHQHEAVTLSLMGGFMIGALKKLWPWDAQTPVENPYPNETVICFSLMIIAAVVVVAIDFIARPKAEDPL
ncbi:DUF368 domain-containing protein [Blastopirellula marina]|uniref:DUF368 domain-containing protein n=1 Tax=Blastopirellula marina TaxID=124 RepID=A0A2S8FNT4_9BACT|nr:DUF368 domain-containing protein [Blastopirellula marina]PQO33640.1 DUF368 domain-containing protein [Blastopirellula marina]PTL43427.1 DUF368 domain-containing protein [Blastopirellula marina]